MNEQPQSTTAQGPQQSRVNKKWLGKFGVFALMLLGLGTWGVLDAFWIYPARGEKDSAVKLHNYLLEANKAGRLFGQASVPSPHEVRAELKEIDAKDRTPLEQAQFMWLESIGLIQQWGLTTSLEPTAARNETMGPMTLDDITLDGHTAETPMLDLHALSRRTVFEDARELLDVLKKHVEQNEVPKPLSTYDLPVQWLFVLIGIPGGLWLIGRIILVRATKYTFDESSLTLTLPNGKQITPADIEDIDARKWDKYYLFVKLKGENSERKFDLYRWTPLEEWLAAQTRAAGVYWPGDPDEDEAAASEEGASAQPASQEQTDAAQ